MITRVLNGEKSFYEQLRRAAADKTPVKWYLPKESAIGDEAVFYFGHLDAFVGYGKVQSIPWSSTHGKRRVYEAEVGDILLYGSRVSLDLVRDKFPGWGWTSYPRSYTTPPPAVQEELLATLHALDSANGPYGSISERPARESSKHEAAGVRYGISYFIINSDKDRFLGENDLTIWFRNSLAFTGGPPKYGQQLAKLAPGDICLLYENRKGVVAIGRVLEPWDGKPNLEQIYYEDRAYPAEELPEYRIDVHWFLIFPDKPIDVARLREILGRKSRWSPSEAVTSVVSGFEGIEELIANLVSRAQFNYPEEVVEPCRLPEGAVTTIKVNSYERNSKARSICIKRHGACCAVCKISFKQYYGELGRDYIHVHHLKPLSVERKEHHVDPVEDLRPICPNCHAMLHKKNPPYTIEELREIMRRVAGREPSSANP